jgi:bud site selection protein 20
MGTGGYARKKGAYRKIKKLKRKCDLNHRAKDRDQIQEEIAKAVEKGEPPLDQQMAAKFNDELPGGGQFYCVETAKHFISPKALADHKKSRYYKKRVKELKEEKYTQESAEWAAGIMKEVLPPAHADKITG